MKKRRLLLLLFLTLSIRSIGQKECKKEEHGYLSITAEAETIKYNFTSLKDLEENLDTTLNEMITNTTEKTMLTIDIAINLTLTDSTITFTASTTAPRDAISETVKKLYISLLRGVSD